MIDVTAAHLFLIPLIFKQPHGCWLWTHLKKYSCCIVVRECCCDAFYTQCSLVSNNKKIMLYFNTWYLIFNIFILIVPGDNNKNSKFKKICFRFIRFLFICNCIVIEWDFIHGSEFLAVALILFLTSDTPHSPLSRICPCNIFHDPIRQKVGNNFKRSVLNISVDLQILLMLFFLSLSNLPFYEEVKLAKVSFHICCLVNY